MDLESFLNYAREIGASDIHLIKDNPPVMRIDGKLEYRSEKYPAQDFEGVIRGMMTEAQNKWFDAGNDVDFSIADNKNRRYRINVFREYGKIATAIRVLNDVIPTMEQLHLPEVFKNFAMLPRGLVLVTGPTGSGKSTSLASMINYANQNRQCHILTAEDPIEYRFTNAKSVVNQREVGRDVKDFATALRSALREDPDVILVGEMRDYETISAAVTAAETGHLVFSTLHTTGASKTVDRIIDVFPAHQQAQIKAQLASVLRAVITQQLIPKIGGGRTAAFEIMVCTDAINNMIREGKTFQIDSSIQTGQKDGMILLDKSLADLVNAGVITYEDGLERCVREVDFNRLASRGGTINTKPMNHITGLNDPLNF